MTGNQESDVRMALQYFQNGYLARDVARLDDFMQLFVPADSIEMIGIGAARRAANEWFEGPARIREIVENDWLYWGDVRRDGAGAKITVHGDVAWLSTCAACASALRGGATTGPSPSPPCWYRLGRAGVFIPCIGLCR